MNDVYFFEFEKTTLYFRRCSVGWMAFLPNSGVSHRSLVLTLSRTVANWRSAGSPPSGYPKNAMDQLEVGSDERSKVLLRHPLEVCDDYEAPAIARLLSVPDPEQVLCHVLRTIEIPAVAEEFRESRGFYRGIADYLLELTSRANGELSKGERVEIVGDTLAQRFVEHYISVEVAAARGQVRAAGRELQN